MPNDITLHSIEEWYDWYGKLRYKCLYHDVWDSIRTEDRKDWLERPDAINSTWAAKRQRTLYDEQQKGRREVLDWIVDHVSPPLRNHLLKLESCSPEAWIDELMSKLDICEDTLKKSFQPQYVQAMLSLSRKPANYLDWINDWNRIMIRCRNIGLMEANDPSSWWPTLYCQISNVLDWPAGFESAHSDEIANNSITFETVVEDLRLEFRRADMEAELIHANTIENDPALVIPAISMGNRKRRKCIACRSMGHTVDNCFYLWDDLRYDGWTPKRGPSIAINRQLRDKTSHLRKVVLAICHRRRLSTQAAS